MKKTLNINLAGYPFTIDEDAYNMLKDYLDTIRYAFETTEDTGELAADIEARIAEILIENENGTRRIIYLNEISRVIERIGKPSDFIEVEEDTIHRSHKSGEEEIKIEEEKITPPPYEAPKHSRNPFVRKNLFRDPQNAMLGGVCAGLAVYLGIDVTIIRLLTVLLFFLSASTVAIVYIVLWIVVPEASTPLQRMKMKGENPTVENIGKTVTGDYQENETDINTTSLNGPKRFLSTVFSIFVKCLVIIGLLIAVPLLFALGIGLFGCVIAVIILGIILIGGYSPTTGPLLYTNGEEIFAIFILLAVIGGIIAVGIPLWLLLRSFWKKKETPYNPANQRALLIVWLCGIALLTVFTAKSIRFGKSLTEQRVNNIEQIEDSDIDEENLESVEINQDGIIIKDKNDRNVIISRGGMTIETEESERIMETIDSIQSTTGSPEISGSPNDTIKK